MREAARAINKELDGPDSGPFDAVKALHTPEIKNLMHDLDALVIEPPPADAPFVAVTITQAKGSNQNAWTVRGWLLHENDTEVEILTPLGGKETQLKAGKLANENGISQTSTVAKVKFEDAVARIENNKKESNGVFLIGQLGQDGSLYEAFIALQLYNSGKEELAVRVLFHALDMLDRDSDLLPLVSQHLGQNYGYQMLTAFAGDRDYARTEKFAALITEHYPKTMFSDYAVKLTSELPKRRDDLHGFKLPMAEEWAHMKAKMSRNEQIDYLSQRMRLLNCFQHGQPGGPDLQDTQYAEPCGISPDAAWGRNMCKTEVINPYVELVGGEQNYFGNSNVGSILANNLNLTSHRHGLELTPNDIPHLSKYLRDDQLLPTVSFFRDFAPGRNLESTRPLFAKIINDLAGGDICHIHGWDKLQPAQIDKEIERINLWASQSAGKTPDQLEWVALDEEIANGTAWTLVQGRVERLLEQKQARAYDIMEHYRTDNKSSWYDTYTILSLYLKYDPAKAKDIAPQYLQDTNDMVRLAAGMIVFKTGDKAAARSAIGKSLAHGWINLSTVEAADLLLNDGTPESRAEVARLFTNKRVDYNAYNGAGLDLFQLLKRCLSAGMIEPYQYSIRQLESKAVASRDSDATGKILHVNTEAEMFAKEFIDNVVPYDPGIQKIVHDFPNDEDKIAPLEQWLQSKLNASQPADVSRR